MSTNRREVSEAVTALGWRYVLGWLYATVAVTSLTQGAELAARLAAAGAGGLLIDLRPAVVILRLRAQSGARVGLAEVDTARRIADVVSRSGATLTPGVPGGRRVQMIEIAIDALDIPRVRPFWCAVMAYAEDPDDPESLVDPLGQGPAIWFQQMDRPRPQRNRIHFDVSVPHDEAAQRIEATLGAGGTLISDRDAPAFWVLADPEGNEACICTWQGRD